MVSTLRRATYTGADDITSAFLSLYQGNVCYSIWPNDKVPSFQYVGNDREKGVQFFEDHITALQQAGNDELFFLRFHPAMKKAGVYVDKKTVTISETPFRVTEIGEGAVTGTDGQVMQFPGGGAMNIRMFEAVEAIRSLPAKMDERQTAFEAKVLEILETPEPETDQPEPGEKYINMAIGALQNPNIMQNIAGILKMIFPGYTMPNFNAAATVSGITETETVNAQTVDIDKLNDALERLSKHCKIDDDLEKLAQIAERDPKTFAFLLRSLRNN